jgi:hypothetical protein
MPTRVDEPAAAEEDAVIEGLKLRLAYVLSVEAFVQLNKRLPKVTEQAEIAAEILTARRVAADRDRCHRHAGSDVLQ